MYQCLMDQATSVVAGLIDRVSRAATHFDMSIFSAPCPSVLCKRPKNASHLKRSVTQNIICRLTVGMYPLYGQIKVVYGIPDPGSGTGDLHTS